MQKFKRIHFQLLLLLYSIVIDTHAQNVQPLKNIGDAAQAIRVSKWLKGNPVDTFEKGKTYVVEFWASWCAPCKAAMPHLSALARKYRNKITFIGMDIYEHTEGINTSLPDVEKFVDSMRKQMDYNVATEDSDYMETEWLDATGAKIEGIPRAFVINAEGQLAWIGAPEYLDKVLPKVLNKTWDIKLALNTRLLNKKLFYLDDSLYYDLYKFRGDEESDTDNGHKPYFIGKPDSILFAVYKILQSEPELKFTPWITYYTFSSLLKTDLRKACEYGKEAIITRPSSYDDATYETFDRPPVDMIIAGVDQYTYLLKYYPDKIKFSTEIYELGIEAYRIKIHRTSYPKISHISKYYNNMAAWYWLANNKSKAIHAQRKAIKALKKEQFYFSKTDLAAFKLQLKKYKRNNPL